MKKLSFLLAASILMVGCESSGVGLSDGSFGEKSGDGAFNSPKPATSTTTSDASVKSGSSTEGGTSTNGNQTNQTPTNTSAGQITAAEWNDLANWDFWKSVSSKSDFSSYVTLWRYNLQNRVSVHVTSQGSPQVDAQVELLGSDDRILWTARTDNKGNAELWPATVPSGQQSTSGLRVRIGTQIFENIRVTGQGTPNDLVVESGKSAPAAIDVAFMVDATSSMSDELEFLKTELMDVISTIKSRNGNASINTGTVFYRDVGDQYVTKVSGFTSENAETIRFMEGQSAKGGGDWPEAVHTALDASLNSLEWSSSAKARILFLVLDAPPHEDDQIIANLNELVRVASAKGVRVVPIACSGTDYATDKKLEFFLRSVAIATGGTYVFVTDDSGIGNSHTVASVGDYQVEYLNSLMVRLIQERIK